MYSRKCRNDWKEFYLKCLICGMILYLMGHGGHHVDWGLKLKKWIALCIESVFLKFGCLCTCFEKMKEFAAGHPIVSFLEISLLPVLRNCKKPPPKSAEKWGICKIMLYETWKFYIWSSRDSNMCPNVPIIYSKGN